MYRFSRLFARGRIRIGLLLAMTAPFLIACGEDTTGPTNPDAELVLLAPQGNETYHIGDSLQIRWKAQGKGLEEITSVIVSLSPDSGTTWASLKDRSIPIDDVDGTGAFGWRIPATLTAKGITFALTGRKVLFRVQDYQNTSDPNRTAIVPSPVSILP